MAEALGNRKKTFETSDCKIAKVEVAGPNPVSRSNEFKGLGIMLKPFFLAYTTVASVFASVCQRVNQNKSESP